MKGINRKLAVLNMVCCSLYGFGAIATEVNVVTNNYEVNGDLVQDRVLSSEGTIAENLKRLFSELDNTKLPSGILLEKGALLHREAILQSDGNIRPEKDDRRRVSVSFTDMYAEFSYAAKNNEQIPSLGKMKRLAQQNYERFQALPLAISLVNYESLQPEALEDGRLIIQDDKLYHLRGQAAYWQSSTFVSAGLPDYVDGMCQSQKLVLPSDMLVTNQTVQGRPVHFESATIQFDGSGESISVQPDMPFELPFELNGKESVPFSITINTSGGMVAAEGKLELPCGIADLPYQPPLPHCDLPQAVATQDYGGVYGRLNPRVYPASGNTDDCHQLERVLVIVDGFDILNNRNATTLWNEFGEGIRRFIELGYDVVTVDYHVGNDYIQRNGLAFKTFMVDIMPTLMDSDPDTTNVAIIAGSMGAQVVNYGLRHAELDGDEHHARLFMAFDTEYQGANIPIGLQLELAFLDSLPGDSDTLGDFVEAVNSPSARQLLIHHYNGGAGIYAADALFSSFNTEIHSLGLPLLTRNVGVANGSGTGDDFNNGLRGNLSHVSAVEGIKRLYLSANTDHNGRVFHGKLKVLGLTLTEWQYDIFSGALADDVRPGGFRSSSVDIASGYNGSAAAIGTMSYELGRHAFVPTESALGADFDDIYHEKCNSQHASLTVGNLEVFETELVAMRDGVTPAPIIPWTGPCAEPEPELCAQSVAWWDDTFISPTIVGASCKVADVPVGKVGFVEDQDYYLENEVECPAPSSYDFVNGNCLITTMPPGGGYSSGTGIITIFPYGGSPIPAPCPVYSVFDLSGGDFPVPRLCDLIVPIGYSPGDVEQVGGRLFLDIGDPCPIGTPDYPGCWMGEAPAGTTPTIAGDAFYYIE
ncbi:hypothetical protein HWQ46_19050 [Shewanella sp. D64]|uniref:hypothetical protein n=1 Tax=unclassified Shewanella TaxID=196818 RepID=UPI0022BA507B|nr:MULTISPECIES: hypothetical protein [unclassified Shewanella]MEC4727647.1 hypothetical protein [Shewanella sp. D64]MEC4739780.1 hypothetical protein [Shewanella sp. E94]WBJ94046.1 hypothetical protein HWQ47_19365 [Shewanella sp. MTB7]